MATFKSKSLKDTKEIAEKIIQTLTQEKTNTLALIGDLGAGKTALTQLIAKSLGVDTKVSSPTFVLMNSYNANNPDHPFTKLFHIDLYRLDTEEELSIIDLPTISQDKNNLIIIEWADKMPNLLPDRYLEVKISQLGEIRKFNLNTIK